MNQHSGPRQKRIGNARKIKNAGKNLIVKGHLDVLGCKPTALDLWDTSVCVYLQCSFRVSSQSLLSSLADKLTVALSLMYYQVETAWRVRDLRQLQGAVLLFQDGRKAIMKRHTLSDVWTS